MNSAPIMMNLRFGARSCQDLRRIRVIRLVRPHPQPHFHFEICVIKRLRAET